MSIRRDEPELIERALQAHVRSLRERFPEITRAIWFGSRVQGRPTRLSDVDLCIVLTHSDQPFLDRIPRFLPDRFPTAVDVFPYTAEEFEELSRSSQSWYREITRGREM